MDNVRFREHCQMWHQYNGCDRFDQQRPYPPAYNAPPQKAWEDKDNRWQNHQKVSSVSNFSSSYRVQHSASIRNSFSNSAGFRCRRSFNQSLSNGSFPPRRTLIDTFIERNEEYWKKRVTIKIDVAFTDHSHVIGKQGRNTQSIMKDTGCHIHFPDSNRHEDMEKSNTVSIAGPLQSVDKARQAIRSLAPLVITLETKLFVDDPNSLSEDPLFTEISAVHGLHVLVRNNRSSGTPFFVVRGSVHQTKEIRDAVLRIQQRFLETTMAICSTAIDVLKPQQAEVIGQNDANIQLISQRTGATIYYPRGDAGAPTTFFIQGTIDSILDARRHIIGCLPMSFAFDLPKDRSDPAGIDDLQNEFGLFITLRHSRNGDPQMVIIKGHERQATSMYSIRHRLLANDDESLVVANDYDFMKDFNAPGFVAPSVDGIAASSVLPHKNIATANVPAFPFLNPFSVVPFSPLLPPTTFPLLANVGDQHYFNCWSAREHAIDADASDSLLPSDKGAPAKGATDCDMRRDSVESKPSSLNDPLPEEAPLASGLLQAAKKIQETEKYSNWKAPGSGRNSSVDYEKEQVLATKAMREKPHGPRFPTDHWSGLGFSRSMPPTVTGKADGAKAAATVADNHLGTVDEDAGDKIGPWPLAGASKQRKVFNASTYFDCGGKSQTKTALETDDIAMLLSQLGLAKYAGIFQEQEVDVGTLLTLTDADLKEMGVNTFGARRKLLIAISEMKDLYRRRR